MQKRLYSAESVVTMRARRRSEVRGARVGEEVVVEEARWVRSAEREVVGRALVVLRPIPRTEW